MAWTTSSDIGVGYGITPIRNPRYRSLACMDPLIKVNYVALERHTCMTRPPNEFCVRSCDSLPTADWMGLRVTRPREMCALK